MPMNGLTNEQTTDFNAAIIEEFRANEGRCGGRFEGNPMLLMTMTGAKSGRTLTSPLTYHDLDGTPIVMASAGGHPHHPHWFHNLVADPAIEIELGTERYPATARRLVDDERQRAFESMTAAMPRFADYQAGVEREIPLFALERRAEA